MTDGKVGQASHLCSTTEVLLVSRSGSVRPELSVVSGVYRELRADGRQYILGSGGLRPVALVTKPTIGLIKR